ncbi:MAG: DUF2752 domain-containing protein [Chitinophagales bacterium]|nr:DUF2752 domain-containing protein [Chitinophagales bacterium]
MPNKKIHLLIAATSLVGIGWLSFAYHHPHSSFTICFIKNVTGFPCPACGSTRSAVAILHGNLLEAFFINPLGYVVVCFLFIAPIGLAFDLLFRKQVLAFGYRILELTLTKKTISIPLVLLLAINWCWNIAKGL